MFLSGCLTLSSIPSSKSHRPLVLALFGLLIAVSVTAIDERLSSAQTLQLALQRSHVALP